MRRAGILLALALMLLPGASHARSLAVEVWTDKGNDAVYQPGDKMEVNVRTSDDAHVLVYEIDTEGLVRLLFPEGNSSGFLGGRETYRVPAENSGVELVVQEAVGQSYIVAIASAAPFDSLPWYLRPYNPQAEAVGYVGEPNAEEGVTAEGRIVGDPFVAMERIRRRVLEDEMDGETFATAYTSYYVHQAVRYPRYVCYDCHRPGQWAWWDGFDPYYSTCSVFDLRVNWSWYWGPGYWYGHVPYFVYVYRPNCPPRYHHYNDSWYSSWDGWGRWCNLWGEGTLRRYKSSAPPGYQAPPNLISDRKWRAGAPVPPGYLADVVRRGRSSSPFMPVGRKSDVRGEGVADGGPAVRTPRGNSAPWAGRSERPSPAMRPRDDSSDRGAARREERPAQVRPREEYTPPPAQAPARREPAPAAQAPRSERPAPSHPAPAPDRPRGYSGDRGAQTPPSGRTERPSGRAEGARETGGGGGGGGKGGRGGR